MIVPYRSNPVHPGLWLLLAYATKNHHSSQWVGAILTILAREGVARG